MDRYLITYAINEIKGNTSYYSDKEFNYEVIENIKKQIIMENNFPKYVGFEKVVIINIINLSKL